MPKSRSVRVLSPFALASVVVLAAACGRDPSPTDAQPSSPDAGAPAPPPTAAPQSTPGIVACFYDEARAAGVGVLSEGGSASDAFVAATLVDYVRAAGETSLGGPLGAMTFEAKTGEVRSLDAMFDAVHDPSGLYNPSDPKPGATVLVPGALRGLEALWKAKGKLSWARVVEPAKRLAADGYAADALLVAQIEARRTVLEKSAYASSVYLPGGKPLTIGAIVKQPELASFLDDVAKTGSSAMYDDGAWAQSFVAQVNEQGGKATASDLFGYEARWQAPWVLEIEGKKVFANAGRGYGGVYGLIGLSVLAHDERDPKDLSNVERVERELRTARAIYETPWFYDAKKLDDHAFVERQIADTSAIWAKVAAQLPTNPARSRGSHSTHVTVVDRDGDAVTGTNTIHSLPWGSGIFVRGVALTEAGGTTAVPEAGQRVPSGLALHVVTTGNVLHYIGGAFGSSLLETELQLLTAATLDAPLDVATIIGRSRFGTFPFDSQTGMDTTSNWIDSNAPSDLVSELQRRGLKVKRDPYGDTGWATFVLREPSGALVGGTLDSEWFRGGAQEVPWRSPWLTPAATGADQDRRDRGRRGGS